MGADRVRIPADIDSVVSALNGLDPLRTASKWERAAVVFAFTRDSEPSEIERGNGPLPLLPREFAALGIVGLKSDQTVRRYRHAWAWAVEQGSAQPVQPGDAADLPDVDWELVPRPEPPAGYARLPYGYSEGWWSVIDSRREQDPGPADDVNRWVAEARAAVRVLAEHRALWSLLTDDDIRLLRGLGQALRGVIAGARAARQRQRAA